MGSYRRPPIRIHILASINVTSNIISDISTDIRTAVGRLLRRQKDFYLDAYIRIFDCGLPNKISEMHAEICRTLGSAARIEILNALQDGEKTVGEITEALELRQANV